MEETNKANEAKLAEEAKKFQELLSTPMSEEEAKVALSDNDVERVKLNIVRQKWCTQIKQAELNISALDEQLNSLDMERAMIFRRTLNSAK